MKNGEKSLNKLFDLIELISRSPQGISGKELAEVAQIPLSTTFRMLKFMTDREFLQVNKGIYTLGLSFVRWGNVASNHNQLIKASRPVLKELARQTRECVHLAELQGNQIVYIDKYEGSNPIRLGSRIGQKGPLHCTGVGKAIFAYQNQQIQEELLAAIQYEVFTPTTIRNETAMRKELELIRNQGYAIDNCEHEEWVFCIAVPILDQKGKCIAGISISGAEVYVREDSPRLIKLITAASRQITANLA